MFSKSNKYVHQLINSRLYQDARCNNEDDLQRLEVSLQASKIATFRFQIWTRNFHIPQNEAKGLNIRRERQVLKAPSDYAHICACTTVIMQNTISTSSYCSEFQHYIRHLTIMHIKSCLSVTSQCTICLCTYICTSLPHHNATYVDARIFAPLC